MPDPFMPRSSVPRPDAAPPRLLAVVVLYRMQPAQSKTLAGLAQAFRADAALEKQIDVLVWDNSSTAVGESSLPFGCTYRHAPANAGVSGAYNAAAAMAGERDCAWLLLLDQDTSITAEFLRGMLQHAAQAAGDEQVAAIVPFLYAGSFCLSPRLWHFGRHVPLPRPASGLTERREMFAANSGTLMRVRALHAIGGYSSRFWLDYSDIDLFHRLHAQNFAVRIAADLTLQHEVALLDYDARMTPSRYATYLAAEGDFLDLYRGRAERLLHLLRLAVRAVRQRRFADKTFSRMTRQELWRRLHVRRRARLRARG
ncbi:MAG: glycosyltransferase [Acidobacteriaceae bacterium]